MIAHATFDLIGHLVQQREFSESAFGPGENTALIAEAMLPELSTEPHQLGDWLNIVLFGLDGAWRTGADPAQICQALADRLVELRSRAWPDWHPPSPEAPADDIEHADA